MPTNPFDRFDSKSTAANPFDKFDGDKSTRAATPQRRAFMEAPHHWWGAIAGPLEAAAHIVSGTGAQVAGGLAGIADIPVNLIKGQSLPNAVANAGDVTSAVENALTYDPRTAVGHDITNVVQYPFQKLAQGADWAGGKAAGATGSPALGAAITTGIQALPMLVGARGPFRAAAPSDFAPAISDAAVAAHNAGLKLTPTQVEAPGGVLGRVAESLSSHAKLERALSRKNAPTVDALAAKDIGIDGPITEQSLAGARAAPNAVYNEVAGLGKIAADDALHNDLASIQAPGAASFPTATTNPIDALRAQYDQPVFDARDVVDSVRSLRHHGFKNTSPQFDPDRNALGQAQLDVANALESRLDRHLEELAQDNPEVADLMGRFRDARTTLAKVHSVQRALEAGAGQNVSAAALAKQMQKGVPLTGNLRTIAKSAQSFPRAFQDIQKIRNSGPISMMPAYGGSLLTALHPSLWPTLAGTLLGPPLLRAILSSDRYQRALAQYPRVPRTYARAGLRNLGAGGALMGTLEQSPQPVLQPQRVQVAQ